MAYTTIPTITTGDVATASWGNAYLKNNFAATAPGVVTTAGDIVYATAVNAIARLAIGTANQLLRVNAGATAPEWASTLAGLTLTTPTINGAALSGTLSGTPTFSGAVVLSGSPSFTNANPFTITRDQVLTVATTAQTTGAATLTIPDFAGVSDTFVFKTKAETLANKTLTAPVINGIVTSTGLTLPAFTAAGDITGGSGFQVATSAGNLVLSPAGNLILKNGLNFIGDTANANMTLGLTINQGAADDEALSLKSSDVAHGVTTYTETDTYFHIRKSVATGGVFMFGMSSNAITQFEPSFAFVGAGGAGDTTKSTAGEAYIRLQAAAISGAGLVSPGADTNLVSIRAHGTTRFLFDAEGSGHADVEWVAFGEHDDLALVDALQHEWTGRITPAKYGDNPLYYSRGYLEDAGIVGKDSWHVEHRPDGRVQLRSMVNFTKLAMLHHGALLQVAERFRILEKQMRALEEGQHA